MCENHKKTNQKKQTGKTCVKGFSNNEISSLIKENPYILLSPSDVLCLYCNLPIPIGIFFNTHGSVRKTTNYIKFCSKYCRAAFRIESGDNGLVKRKKDIVEKKGGICFRCKQAFPLKVLALHHPNESFKSGHPSDILYGSSAAYERAKDELEKCQILCHNCHTLTHMEIDDLKKKERTEYSRSKVLSSLEESIDTGIALSLLKSFPGNMLHKKKNKRGN